MTVLARALQDLKLVDLGAGLGAAIAAKFYAELGAAVTRIEPAGGDPFYGVYPAYASLHDRAVIEHVADAGSARIADLIEGANLCLVGGESWPDRDWRFDVAALSALYPHVVFVEIEAAPPAARVDGPMTEILAQARTGLASEQFSKKPLYFSFSPASYGSALHAVTGGLAALRAQFHGARGLIVRTSLFEGAMTYASHVWQSATKPSGGFLFEMPKDPHPLIFRTRDGKYLQFVLGSAGSKGHMYRILKIDDPTVRPDDSGQPTGLGDPKNFFGDIDVLAAHVINFDLEPLLAEILAAGIAAEEVLPPGACWDDPQTAYNGYIVRGAKGIRRTGLPMRGDVGLDAVVDDTKGAVLEQPLAGLRVVDFGMFVAGPFGGVALGDLGADVIKVEPMANDPNRTVYRSFVSVNRGKRSIKIDVKSPKGKEVVTRLCVSADIVTSNFRPGVSTRLGVDPARLRKLKPSLVVLESSGWGRTGPKGDRPGFDMMFQAFCGLDVHAGGKGNPPLWNRAAMVDYVQGSLNSIAMLAGLYRRDRTGGGADVESTLLDAGTFLLSELIQYPNGTFGGLHEVNATQTGIHPATAYYQTQGGWIAVDARGDAMASAFAAALGLSDLAGKARVDWDDEDARTIAAAILPVASTEIVDSLRAAGIWVEPVVENGNVMLNQPGFLEAGNTFTADHPVYGTITGLGSFFRMEGSRMQPISRLPMPGEHTREILSSIDYSDDEIAALIAEKVVAES